jgi:SAM-dependent methyltransferase
MPTVEENLGMWSNYDWSKAGDEWSQGWGGTSSLWWGSLFPRIRHFLPAKKILEIAPGYGRFTDYIRFACEHLDIVDLTPRCIEACKQRFAESSNISYFLNDGKSLDIIADDSIDFVFSFDSLVHVELEVLETYLHQLKRKMKANSIGFFHHSNIGEYVDPATGDTPFENVHWRAKSVTAQKFAEACDAAGLQCITQEIINWGGEPLCDCLSVFTPQSSRWARSNQVVRNGDFWKEALHLANVQQQYELVKNQRNKSNIPFIKQLQNEVTILKDRVSAMETSKFWKFRKTWFQLKKTVGLGNNE